MMKASRMKPLKLRNKNKKGGFEMSITTLVIIVIAVVMLILGLTLVRQIFGGASKSMSVMEAGMMDKVKDIFSDEGGTISLFSKTVDISPGTMGFNIPIGFQTVEGGTVAEEGMRFKVEVLEGGANECGKNIVEGWIEFPSLPMSSPTDAFSKVEGNVAGLDIVVSVPKNTPYCTQPIRIKIFFKEITVGNKKKYGYGDGKEYSSDTVILNIKRGGVFG